MRIKVKMGIKGSRIQCAFRANNNIQTYILCNTKFNLFLYYILSIPNITLNMVQQIRINLNSSTIVTFKIDNH